MLSRNLVSELAIMPARCGIADTFLTDVTNWLPDLVASTINVSPTAASSSLSLTNTFDVDGYHFCPVPWHSAIGTGTEAFRLSLDGRHIRTATTCLLMFTCPMFYAHSSRIIISTSSFVRSFGRTVFFQRTLRPPFISCSGKQNFRFTVPYIVMITLNKNAN